MITPDFIRSKMQVPPNLQDSYMRVVLAGKKIMYSPQMQGQIVQLLKGPGSMGDKLAQGAIALISILIEQSQRTVPPQLIVPAATELVAEAADFLRKSGMKVSDKDIADGIATMVQSILQKAGVTPDKLPSIIQQISKGA